MIALNLLRHVISASKDSTTLHWKGTPVESSLTSLITRGVPIGGTSAAMNVLTEFIYSALASQGVISSQPLADPFNRYITLDRDFVSIAPVQGIVGDPHFVTRDRIGRDLPFLCRIFTNGWSTAPRSISIDEQTALLIDANANGTVVGSSTVHFLQAPGAPQVCQAGTPLTYQNISANAGVLGSTQSGGSIY